MRRQSLKRQRREREAKPVRDALLEKVARCEVASVMRSRCKGPLCCHEIIGGPHRGKMLDVPAGLLVVCNLHNIAIHAKDRALQFALVKLAGRDDMELIYELTGRRWPDLADIEREYERIRNAT